MRSLTQLMDLSGRRALVVGGAGHIGRAASETLAELGAAVAVLDRDRAACEETVRILTKTRGRRAFAFPCDLMDETLTRRTVRAAAKRLGGLDILIHAAAYTNSNQGWAVPLNRQTTTAWEEALHLYLTSAFVTTQEARGILNASGHGSVIFISSIYGLVGPDFRLYAGTTMGNPVGYGAAKGGLLQVARYLATMLAPRIRVNVISPGGVRRKQPTGFRRRYVQRTPLGRMATEEDLKGAVAYLASDLSSYVTGQNLVVDGGWTAW